MKKTGCYALFRMIISVQGNNNSDDATITVNVFSATIAAQDSSVIRWGIIIAVYLSKMDNFVYRIFCYF